MSRRLTKLPASGIALSRAWGWLAALLVCVWAAAPGAADDLSYNWKPGQEYGYNVTLDIEAGGQKSHDTGTVRFRAENVPQTAANAEEVHYTGTGFVIHPDGYLLTCQHVIDRAAKIEVTLGDKKYEATLLGQDKLHDVALLKIDGAGLPTLPLADSDKVEIGEEMFAIGFPLTSLLGQSIKMSRGILSGVQEEAGEKLLLVDAGVNHGNSGGPLVNDRGEVAGVVAMVIDPEMGNNVGFAQPVNEAKRLLDANSVPFIAGAGTESLKPKELAVRVNPSVAFIMVTPKPKSEDCRRLVYSMSVGPLHGSGVTVVDSGGTVQDEGPGDLSIAPLGNVGFEILPGAGEKHWQTRQLMMIPRTIGTVQPSAPQNKSPQPGQQNFANRPSFGRNYHYHSHRGTPRQLPQQPQQPQQPQPQAKVVVVPAARVSRYEIVDNSPGLVTIKCVAAMSTMPPGQGKQAWLTGKGEGTLEVDTHDGVVRRSNFAMQLLNSETNQTISLSLAYERLDGTIPSAPPLPSPSMSGPLANNNSSSGLRPPTPRSEKGGSAKGNPPDEPEKPGIVPAPRDIAKPSVKRVEIPNATARGRAEKLLDDLFEKELAALDSSAKRVALARTMLKHAGTQKSGSADHYVLLEKARDLATAAGDLKLSCEVIDLITTYYEANSLDLKAGALDTLAESVATPDDQRQLVAMALALLDQAIAADQLQTARQLGKVAYAAAKKTDDKALVAQTAERGKAFKALQKDYEEFKKAIQTLKDDPKNAAANTVAGKHYCLVKDDWKEGLPLLALCDDAAVAKLAALEADPPKEGQAMFELAEGWDDLADKEQGTRKTRIQVHARSWYQKALPSLSGLARAKAEKYLASSPTSVSSLAATGGVGPVDSKAMFERIGQVIQGGGQKKTRELGSTSEKLEFSVVPPQGGVLIGFDVNANEHKILGLRPIFMTSQGRFNGRWCGMSKSKAETKRLLARDGYAIGALKVKAGQGINGLSVQFMEIGSDGLVAGNSYESDWIGDASGAKSSTAVGGNGSLVIGIHGHANVSELSSLSLVLAAKK